VKTRSDVRAIAAEVIGIHDQIAKVQSDPEHDTRIFRLVLVGFGHGLLECDSGVECVHSAWKLDQRSVARQQRKLAAILAADVVGYSRLMGRDESGTLARLREHRKECLEPALARYGGRRRGSRCRAA
jgi:hypothetical protein